jgi:hypothetical protein
VNFLVFSITSRPALEPTQPHVQWVPGVKQLWREVDHSHPFSAVVSIGGIIPPLPQASSRCGV